jgi:anti-anti-sigma factor
MQKLPDEIVSETGSRSVFHSIPMNPEKPLAIGAADDQNGVRAGPIRPRALLASLLINGTTEAASMETLVLRPHRTRGPVFVREIQGMALVLTPHGSLGDRQESEFTEEMLELLEVINHSGPTNLVFDLQQGNYASSAFLGALVRLWKRVAQRGGRMALCHVSDQVFQILRMTKLHTVWPILVSREDALRAVGA